MVVHVRRPRPRSTNKAMRKQEGVVVRGALDPVRVHANAMLCAHAPGRTWSRTPRGRDMPYGLCPAQALWQSGSRWSRPGRAAAAGELGVAVVGGQRGGCAVCVFRAWPLCVLATGVAADEFAGRGVVGSVSAAEPPRITDVSRLLSPLDSHDTANEVYVHIYPWSYGNKRQRQQSTARRPFSHLSLSL